MSATAQELVTAVVIDDHPFYRDGITRGLTRSARVRVVAEAGDGRTGLDLIRRWQPDVAVVDERLPDLDGVAVTRAVRRDGLRTSVLLLSAITDSAVVFLALQEGASGFISKEADRDDIVDAVVRVARGETVVPPDVTAGLVDQIRTRRLTDQPVLSQREQQVLRGFARGQSVPQLAAELFLGASTVKTHTQRLYEKLGVSDRAAAVAEGMRRGLLE